MPPSAPVWAPAEGDGGDDEPAPGSHAAPADASGEPAPSRGGSAASHSPLSRFQQAAEELARLETLYPVRRLARERLDRLALLPTELRRRPEASAGQALSAEDLPDGPCDDDGCPDWLKQRQRALIALEVGAWAEVRASFPNSDLRHPIAVEAASLDRYDAAGAPAQTTLADRWRMAAEEKRLVHEIISREIEQDVILMDLLEDAYDHLPSARIYFMGRKARSFRAGI